MAKIEYNGAIEEIKKIFKKKDFDERKIIFWYDAPRIFKEDLLNDTLDFCKLLVCEGNEFQIKMEIEHNDLTSDILVYIPNEKPNDKENWLLDILCYGEEYYADTVALAMRNLGLTKSDLRKVIEKHLKFFDSEARIKKLDSYIDIDDNMTADTLKRGMLAVILKSSSSAIDSLLAELVFDDSQKTKYKELVKYGFEEYIWDEIASKFNYEGAQSIDTLTKRFLFTTMIGQGAVLEGLHSFYKQFVIEGAGKTDAKQFVEDRLKKDKRYEALQSSYSVDMKIDELIVSKRMTDIQTTDVFECIDVSIIDNIANFLKNGSLDYDAFEKTIHLRINSMWYEKYKSEYEVLISVISLMRLLEKPIPKGLTSNEYIELYANTYYAVDTNYRHMCVSYKQIENPTVPIEELVYRTESKYEGDFLSTIGGCFSESLSKQNKWEFTGVPSTRDFYRTLQRNQFKKLFVIISDALRYEVGNEINEAIKADPILKGSSELSYAMSMLPSETRFGMASLLPHQSIEYRNEEVYVDGQSTKGIEARNKILKSKNNTYSAISFDEINRMNRNELRGYVADKTIIYIYHNTIDNAGENAENKVFEECSTAVEEIVSLIKKLYNNLQISNYYVTADHGFIYRQNTIMESQKYSNITSYRALETSKRYLITDNESTVIPYTTSFDVDYGEDKLQVITPNGYDLFKAPGAGLQYVHGGTSLQEVVVPVIRISELRSKMSKDDIGPVGVRLKSVTRKITNRSFSLDFEQFEKVEDKKHAISCETYFVNESGEKVSGEYRFIANSTSDDSEMRITKIRFTLKNIEFDRNSKYYLILRNTEKPDEYIEKEQFIIDILGFKLF